METPEQIQERIATSLPGVMVTLLPNPAATDLPSLLVAPEHALAVARFLREDPQLKLDYASNVTGIDWADKEISESVRVKETIEGVEQEFDETRTRKEPGFLEAVYHLYSMELKHGPMILRQRSKDRSPEARVTSLTPIWRGCEFQEREIYDLYGLKFDGHRDLRRILMWEGFKDHPMRKDYVEPDDYEWEPTPHDQVLAKARRHYPPTAAGQQRGSSPAR